MTRLVDSYKRSIEYMRISVTDRCNLRCVYCMPGEGIDLTAPANILRYEELLRIVKISAANGVSRYRITGGEPLVRKGIVDFIGRLSQIEGVEEVSLTTNGVLLTKYAQGLKDAGLNRVNVSLDSLNRARFERLTRGDKLDTVLAGLRTAQNVGLTPVKVNMVVIKGFNDDEIIDFANISKEQPYHIRFIEYMPFNTEEGWQKDKCIGAKEIQARIEKTQRLIPVKGNRSTGPARRFRFEGAPGEVGFISPVTEHFCGACNRLRLTADGKLRTCLFSDTEISLRDALRDGSDDKAIESLLFHAVATKPERHRINEELFKKTSKTMSLIGG